MISRMGWKSCVQGVCAHASNQLPCHGCKNGFEHGPRGDFGLPKNYERTQILSHQPSCSRLGCSLWFLCLAGTWPRMVDMSSLLGILVARTWVINTPQNQVIPFSKKLPSITSKRKHHLFTCRCLLFSLLSRSSIGWKGNHMQTSAAPSKVTL